MKNRILIGTSGYSYDDWRGPFYPEGIGKEEMLGYYAEVFPAVEINATYYGTPGRKTAESMVRRAKGRLAFSIKVPGAITHKGDLSENVLGPWLRFIEPFGNDASLCAVLLQFPAGFHARPDNLAYLQTIRNALKDLPLVVELRHESWDSEEQNRRLAEWQMSRCMVDQPGLTGLSRSGKSPYIGPIPYVRFHGRNSAAWYGGKGMERYTYNYSREELFPWLPIVREAAEEADSTYVFFNNHPAGGATYDAREFADLLGESLGVPEKYDLFE